MKFRRSAGCSGWVTLAGLFLSDGDCPRTYAGCPSGFVAIGDVRETGSGTACAATSSYQGPCSGDAVQFASWNAERKAEWSDRCHAFWPCRACEVDFSGCPKGWTSSGKTCTPVSSYSGPCQGPVSFNQFNAEMKRQVGEGVSASVLEMFTSWAVCCCRLFDNVPRKGNMSR